MLGTDWIAVSAVAAGGAAIVAAVATVISLASLKAARQSAKAATDLVRIEAERRQAEELRSASSRGLTAQEFGAPPTSNRVIRLFNVGPGPVTLKELSVEKENGEPADEHTSVVFSDLWPVELRRGEYTRVDLVNTDLRHRFRLMVDYSDAEGDHLRYRVRTQLKSEHPTPMES